MKDSIAKVVKMNIPPEWENALNTLTEGCEKVFYRTTTLAGVKHNNCQEVIFQKVKVGNELLLLPDPENKFDDTATRVCTKEGYMAGWIPESDYSIFKNIMNDVVMRAFVKEIRKPNEEWDFYNVAIDVYEYVKRNP